MKRLKVEQIDWFMEVLSYQWFYFIALNIAEHQNQQLLKQLLKQPLKQPRKHWLSQLPQYLPQQASILLLIHQVKQIKSYNHSSKTFINLATTPQPNPPSRNVCRLFDWGFKADPESCYRYYLCLGRFAQLRQCSHGHIFNNRLNICIRGDQETCERQRLF